MSALTKNNHLYIQLLQNYQQLRETKLESWLDFESIFNRQGKQGVTGLFNLKKGEKEHKYVFKLSQYINHMALHEALVMKGLNMLANYCPHFCRSYGTIICKVDPKIKKDGNPFEIIDTYPIEKEVLLIENIPGYKFLNHIKSTQIPDNIIYSVIKQVMLAIIIAQRDKKFSHYDLHSNNIILRKCPEDMVLVYILDEENQFCVPTYGYLAVIVDFGFSYIEDMQDEPFWNTLAHTDVGFMIDRFEWLSDPKLFLISVAEDLKEYRKNKKSRRFRRIVKNIFTELDIDWESGWDNYDGSSVADEVNKMLQQLNPGSKTFEFFDHFGIDLIQSLIILPMEPQKYTNIYKPYEAFLKEFIKIETEINSEFYNLYILKKIVDLARDCRPDYLDPSKRGTAIKKFKEGILDSIYKIAKFCHPKKVNYEVMLCSLLYLGRSVEGLMYDLMYIRMKTKQEQYKNLPVKNTMEIFGAIEVSLPSDYEFTEKSEIVILDSINKNSKILQLSKNNISELNGMEPSEWGVYLYGILPK
jgi:hypothetical protein